MTLRFPTREIERLERHAERMGIGKAGLVRMAVAKLLDDQERADATLHRSQAAGKTNENKAEPSVTSDTGPARRLR